jgi:hypothetical protein
MVSTANRVLSSGDGCPAGVDRGAGVELGAGRGRSPCHRPYFFSVPVFVRYFIRFKILVTDDKKFETKEYSLGI